MKLTRALRLGRRGIEDAVRAASVVLNAKLPAPTPFAARAAELPGVMEVPAFGSNPGGLKMMLYSPPSTPRPGAPLIVVLHGCGQDAAGFATESGWLALADRLSLPVVIPAQMRENNQGGCFNWFRPIDTRRGRGEAASIRQMVTEAATGFRSDPKRIFVTGLSAGGSMAAALLASYPDVFAAGAVVSGLPVGCADDVGQAFARMSHAGPALSGPEWADKSRERGPTDYAGRWPRLSIWRGAADHTVDPANSELLAEQWTALHRLSHPSWTETEPAAAVRRRVWGLPEAPVVEMWTLAGLPHAWPIGEGDEGKVSQWVREAAVSATNEIARFWGLAEG
jgi:poly(hydroxyalkanoate) depolymerase family esterase